MTQTLPSRPAAVRALVKQIQLTRGVTPTFDGPGSFRLELGGVSAGAQQVSEWLLDLVRRLSTEAVAEDELQARALALGGPAGLFSWIESVRRLDAAGMLERRVILGEQTVCVLRPVGAGPSTVPGGFDPSGRQRISRFAVVHAEAGVLLARHPDSHLAVELGRLGVAVLGGLADWTSWQQLEDPGRALPGPVVRAVLEQLTRAAILDQAATAGAGAGVAVGTRAGAGVGTHATTGAEADALDHDPAAPWSLFDRWLHARTRNPRIVTGWGGSYPGRGRFPRQPAEKPGGGGELVSLPVPDMADLRRRSASVAEVMERRRSVRVHDDDRPITVDQLAELLYRTVRVRSIEETGDGLDEIVDRPFPSAGALHELEVYPVVRHCVGLAPGLWHYRGDRHALERIGDYDQVVDQLTQAAGSAATMRTLPQVVLVITARFGRTMWKYDSIAYALILKDVGVLLQSWYLVATDLGLAPTAVGAGDADQFAAASGLDRLVEGSVGEFVVGSRPPGPEPEGLIDPSEADVEPSLEPGG